MTDSELAELARQLLKPPPRHPRDMDKNELAAAVRQLERDTLRAREASPPPPAGPKPGDALRDMKPEALREAGKAVGLNSAALRAIGA